MAHPYTILFAVDFSDMTDEVLAAVKTACDRAGGASVHAVCVIEDTHDPVSGRRGPSTELSKLEEALEARVRTVFEHGGVQIHARAGSAAEEIAAAAREAKADLIVVGRHGHSGHRPHIIGSVPTRLLQLAQCSVLVVQPKDYR